jgi:hypothetical protein
MAITSAAPLMCWVNSCASPKKTEDADAAALDGLAAPLL